LISEGKHVNLRLGSKSDHAKDWEAAEAYAMEMIQHGEREIEPGAVGTTGALAPG
jgi:hypothetical protein